MRIGYVMINMTEENINKAIETYLESIGVEVKIIPKGKSKPRWDEKNARPTYTIQLWRTGTQTDRYHKGDGVNVEMDVDGKTIYKRYTQFKYWMSYYAKSLTDKPTLDDIVYSMVWWDGTFKEFIHEFRNAKDTDCVEAYEAWQDFLDFTAKMKFIFSKKEFDTLMEFVEDY